VRQIVLATRNGHKVRELQTLLADLIVELDLEILGMGEFPDLPDVIETGVTFEENATLKAVAASRATGLPALADDSGLAVDVLGGAPGVFSARWAGTQGQDRANLELLLGQLYDVPDEHRAAAFVCAAVLALPDGTVVVREGRMPGTLAREPRGDNGFGYDPILVVEGDTRTSAELTFEEKNVISHRAKAFQLLAADLREAFADK
jgi:XTP/dITP diphosphohydrolase